MDDRPYLSIGDVLTLLQREFPDVTISKIRFLESRGLLVPDRTPSGYRKFYEHDVERLRWILRQQREHFLPLKVIKGRLEGQEPAPPSPLFELGEPAPAASAAGAAGAQRMPGRDAGREDVAGTSAARAASASASGVGASGAETDIPASRFAYANAGHNGLERSPGAVLASVQAAREPGRGAGPESARPGATFARPTPTAAGGAAAPASPQASSAQPAGEADRLAARGRLDPVGHERVTAGGEMAAAPGRPQKGVPDEPQAAARRPAERSGAGAEAADRPAPKDRSGAPASERPGAVPPPPAGRKHDVAPLVGVSLTATELAQASGLEVQQVADLESFGLIAGKMVAGVRCYDEDALVVAGLAAGFAHFGVEARHLRVFKYAAERQTGLYSQIVLPLLRQRNPEARRQALDDVDRLTELGASLQACFARAALRDLTGG